MPLGSIVTGLRRRLEMDFRELPLLQALAPTKSKKEGRVPGRLSIKPTASTHQPLVESLLHRFSVVIPPFSVIPNAHLSVCCRQLRSHSWIYLGDRLFVYRCIWDELGKPMIVFPGHAVGDQFHSLLLIGCSFRNY